jgi:hypothetical protein
MTTLDILSVLIAFTSIILLLSVIVTSLTQLTQATFRLRARNLVVGTAALLKLTRALGGLPSSVAKVDAPALEDLKQAKALLNTVEAGNLAPDKDPNSLTRRLLGPTVSWMDKDTFVRAANAIDEQVSNDAALDGRFRAIEASMEKRFLLRVRWITAAWAIVVALIFQVSTPHYLQELWSNPELRRELEGMAESVLAQGTEAVATFDRYDRVSERALARLTERHPKAAALIEQASGIGTTRGFVIEELRLAVEGSDQRDQIVRDYADLLDEERRLQIDDVANEASRAATSLGAMYVQPFSRGPLFYGSLRNWLGMLITAMLLMLGAPFWFNALKSLVNLRDAMKGRIEKTA